MSSVTGRQRKDSLGHDSFESAGICVEALLVSISGARQTQTPSLAEPVDGGFISLAQSIESNDHRFVCMQTREGKRFRNWMDFCRVSICLG